MNLFRLIGPVLLKGFSPVSKIGRYLPLLTVLVFTFFLAPQSTQAASSECSGFYGFDRLRQRILNSLIINKNGQREILGNVMYEVNPKAWEIASSDPQYVLKIEELRMLEDVLRELQPEHIVEFGPGDGSKAIKIIKESNTISEYTGIDINSEMIAIARKRMGDALTGTKEVDLRFAEPIDLETPQRKKKGLFSIKKVLGLFLGQTLGNPPPEKRIIVLQNMAHLLPPKSMFMTGVALKPESAEMIEKNLKSYAIGQYNTLIMGPLEYLGLGNKGNLKIIWNERENNVEAVFTFDRKITLENGVSFKPGEELLLFRSHRFTIEEIQNLWQEAGFTDVEIKLSESFPYALVKAKTR